MWTNICTETIKQHGQVRITLSSVNMDIIYREFKDADQVSLSSLMSELGYELDCNILCNRIGDIRAHGGEVIVAELGGAVIGCINAIIDIRLAEGKVGEIVSLVVSEEHRGMGIGKALVKRAESWLSSRCDLIRVRANTIRREAHDFYRLLGYQEIKSQKVFTKNV